ncbi:TerD family protein [Brevibacillus porteri]|uniref:TerD family protein n=2 Tax=Brevibacillus porteri TaxID=2126350 RepID=UPI00370B886F
MLLKKGQKTDITKNINAEKWIVCLGWESKEEIEIDSAAFLLDIAGNCQRDEDFIFYGNTMSITQAVKHSTAPGKDKEQIEIIEKKIPPDIHRIALTLTIHEAEKRDHRFGQIHDAYVRVVNPSDGTELLRFEFGSDLENETAIVTAELYRYNGEWKFNAIGSGFNGGLAALCRNFGLDVSEEEETLPPPLPVTLTKIELTKKESVQIRKSEKITTHLEWTSKKDLDLYCFFVTRDGVEGKVYYKNKGTSTKSPFITLDGDSKNAGRETIHIHRPDQLRYVLFAAYSALSNGIGSFKSMHARAVVENHVGQTVIAPLLEENKYAYWVAIAHIDFTDQSEMKISHVEKYSKNNSEKSPLLYKDGSFKMDVGPEEFKSPSIFNLFGAIK